MCLKTSPHLVACKWCRAPFANVRVISVCGSCVIGVWPELNIQQLQSAQMGTGALYNPHPRERAFHQVWDETVAPTTAALPIFCCTLHICIWSGREGKVWGPSWGSHTEMICLTGKDSAWGQVSNPPLKQALFLRGKLTCLQMELSIRAA